MPSRDFLDVQFTGGFLDVLMKLQDIVNQVSKMLCLDYRRQ